MRPAFGGPADGVAAEYCLVPAASVITGVPAHLDAYQAASLPCAGLTAWAAVTAGVEPLGPGKLLVVEGTGGVATFAAQFALASGADVAVVSRSGEKLVAMRQLGARYLIDRGRTPDWGRKSAASRAVPM
ncbi:zinc-binding dehydrogenase [Rhizorhabdus histidinilytica]|nr:hypothetical protein EIK56_27810 [Sphingomonas sp. C8-2]